MAGVWFMIMVVGGVGSVVGHPKDGGRAVVHMLHLLLLPLLPAPAPVPSLQVTPQALNPSLKLLKIDIYDQATVPSSF